ncbi:MAG: Oxidoreductase [Promethearchaeota archaeon]|nr:MAG: Oxidoreductase [Candidatus Lokiarchaeota archaeon]
MTEHATKVGTNTYRERILKELNLPENHFREFLGLKFSSLGMGTYLGELDSKTDKLVTNAVIDSVKGGVNIIDTAINYRLQKAERSIKKALKSVKRRGFERNQYFISTKVGYIPGDADLGLNARSYIQEVLLKENIITRNEIIGMNCMSSSYLKHQITQSLKNLGVNCIDLLYLHNVADAQKKVLGEERFYIKLKEAFELLENLIAQKKIQYYGIATWDCLRVPPSSPVHLDIQHTFELASKAANAQGKNESGFKFFMLPFNFLMPEAINLQNQDGKTVFQKAQELELGLFAAVPLMQARSLGHPKLRPFMEKMDVDTAAQAALQFVRNIGIPLIAPLVGHKQPAHVRENLSLLLLPPDS